MKFCPTRKKEEEGTMKLRIWRHSDDRELNQAQSKPDTVDRPVRSARTFVHHYNSTQYCSTETVFLIFPFSRPTTHLRCGQVEVGRALTRCGVSMHRTHSGFRPWISRRFRRNDKSTMSVALVLTTRAPVISLTEISTSSCSRDAGRVFVLALSTSSRKLTHFNVMQHLHIKV